MMRSNQAKIAFNGGEISPLAVSRIDTEKYQGAVEISENYIPTIQGPVIRRGGTAYVNPVWAYNGEAPDPSDVILLRFHYSESQDYIIEAGHFYFRIYSGHGPLTSSVTGSATYHSGTKVWTVICDSPHGWATGSFISCAEQDNTKRKMITVVDDVTFTVPSLKVFSTAPFSGTFTFFGCIRTPFSTVLNEDKTPRLSPPAQSKDILYFAHPDWPPHILKRTGTYAWSVEPYANKKGPFETPDPDNAIVITANADTGAISLAAAADVFRAEDVGSLFYLERPDTDKTDQWEVQVSRTTGYINLAGENCYEATTSATTGTVRPSHLKGTRSDGGVSWKYRESGYAFVRIDSVTSGTAADGTVTSEPPYLPGLISSSGTANWAHSAWLHSSGYPTKVCFFRNRLVWSRGLQLWFSVANDFEDFSTKDGATITQANSFSGTLDSSTQNDIQWLIGGNVMMAGTGGTEFVVSEESINSGFGPENFRASEQEQRGSKGVSPVRVGNSVFYVQTCGRKVREIHYTVERDAYISEDTTAFAEHVTYSGIRQMTYAQEPYSVIWMARNDGQLIGLTYQPEQNVYAWHRHPTNGEVISVMAKNSPEVDRQELWMIVKRNEQYLVEYGMPAYDYVTKPDPARNCWYVDSGIYYSGYAFTSDIPSSAAIRDESVTLTVSPGSAVIGWIGRYIVQRYQDAQGRWTHGRGLITDVPSPSQVTITITSPFKPGLSQEIGLSATTIEGLDHLEGMAVSILADGAVHEDVVVSGGSIQLDYPACYVVAGLGFTSRVVSLSLESAGPLGSTQGRPKKIGRVSFRFIDTLGVKFGQYGSRYVDQIVSRIPADLMDEPPPLVNGIESLKNAPSTWDDETKLLIEQAQPLPGIIVAAFVELATGG